MFHSLYPTSKFQVFENFKNFLKLMQRLHLKTKLKVDTDFWDTLHIRHQSICILLEDIVSDRLEIIGNKYKTYSPPHLLK